MGIGHGANSSTPWLSSQPITAHHVTQGRGYKLPTSSVWSSLLKSEYVPQVALSFITLVPLLMECVLHSVPVTATRWHLLITRGKRAKWLPPPCEDSDLEIDDDNIDDDCLYPDFLLAEYNDDDDDISLPEFSALAPNCIRSPWEYFLLMLPIDLLEDVVYQTNLYAKQKDVNTSFSMDSHELMQFIGIVIYKGVVQLPSIEDYWATKTRIIQVADVMASKRFQLIRSLLHFNNNENVQASTDRFFKIRPLFSGVTKQFQKVAETPTQSVDEVMVAYKGTRAGSLRQYIQNKPDKWGHKLFCRASIDGFIHDILLYHYFKKPPNRTEPRGI
ncbi:hypothetical protein Pmani_003755 [Petrolisthes manimaculis]|uniref:PiggyBac transposable element-derived protein domain-containing protein n=1 Tax=Petrolisthes manimaculis TaxID=1843537 RepID=A0AAE1QI66_9EUCA|nr:hypothetical protein Pmani_003755 [Petrolisthes manimaculis]